MFYLTHLRLKRIYSHYIGSLFYIKNRGFKLKVKRSTTYNYRKNIGKNIFNILKFQILKPMFKPN